MIRKIYRYILPERIRFTIRNIKKIILRDNYILIESFLGLERYPYKMYCDKYKCIFIHIPKNAGTSVITLLNDNNRTEQEHNPYWDYLRSDPSRFRDYEKFCIVRNPWDRLLSGYEYLKDGGNKGSDKYLSDRVNRECESFHDFVMNWLTFDKIYNIKVLNPQFIYVYDTQNETLIIENIIRFESLDKGFNEMKKKLNIKGELAVLNRTKSNGYSDMYTSKMVTRVADFYAFDIKLFNYQFETK